MGFEQDRQKRINARLAQLSGEAQAPVESEADVEALIQADEAKRAKMRAERQAKRQARVDALAGRQDRAVAPKTKSKSQAKRVAAQQEKPACPPTKHSVKSSTVPLPRQPVKLDETDSANIKRSIPLAPGKTKDDYARPAPPSVPSVSGSTPPPPIQSGSKEGTPPSALSTDTTSTPDVKVVTSTLHSPRTVLPSLPAKPARLGAQIKTDIGHMMGQTGDSSLRSIMSEFLQMVSPFFVEDGDSRFPRGHNPHPTFPVRCGASSFADVVVFHIGTAILSYYAFERGDYTQQDIDNVEFLHEIAVIGLGSHRVKGGAQRGFTLFAVENHERLLEIE